jgi:(p)ppGpp synthase/HD superfamily hydrolase
MLLVSEETEDEDTLVAALFHDIIEDAPHVYSEAQMRQEFGPRVIDIVRGVTHDDSLRDWHERCRAYIANLREAPLESVIVSAADKTHNLMSTLDDYHVVGDDVWKRFRTGKADQLWWYAAVLDVINDRLPNSPVTAQLSRLVDDLRDIAGEAQAAPAGIAS